MRKKIFAFIIVSLFIFFVLTSAVLAAFYFTPRKYLADVMMPPMINISVKYNGEVISESFYAATLVCYSDLSSYEKDLTQYEKWYGDESMWLKSEEEKLEIKEIQKRFDQIKEFDQKKNCYWVPNPHILAPDLTRVDKCGITESNESVCGFQSAWGFFNFKLATYLPSLNKVFITNAVPLEDHFGHIYKYEANLFPDGSGTLINVTPAPEKFTPFYFGSFFKALSVTLLLELLVTLLYLNLRRLPKKRVLLSIFLANMISLPTIWFAFPFLKMGGVIGLLIIPEIFVILLEAFLIFRLNKNTFTFKKALIFSLILNLVSLLVGGFIIFAWPFPSISRSLFKL